MARISRSGTIIILQATRSLTRGAVHAVALARHQPFQPLASNSTSARVPVLYSDGCVCVVVPTYHGHGSRVAEFLRIQLVPQTNSNWFAVVLDTDRPERWTTPLRDVVQSANVGDRAIVSNHTATHYSGNGSYRLTDQAITECPSQCRWLMCTNADNRYHPEALSIVDHEFDVVSMDENRTMQNRTATWLRASLPMDGGGRS